jgi:thioredoxin reductase (NADPH)
MENLKMETNHYNVIIIGGGSAGLTAGIYTSRAKLSTLIINEGTIGGQMILTHEIANYPGVENISGYQLSQIMRKQAESFGCEIKTNIKIVDFQFEGKIKKVRLADDVEFTSDTIIIASGGKSRELGVMGEKEFKGKGISYCATCDGDFFQNKKIVVVGGGNSALEEAVSLTKYASSVTVIHQFDHFQAFEYAIQEAKHNPKINFVMESKIIEFSGTDSLEKVKIQNLKTNEVTDMLIDGTFIFIGYEANTSFLKNKIKMSDYKEIIVDKDMKTNIEGVFSAGDCNQKRYRQITTSVSDGTIAALSVADYINKIN